MSYLRDFMSMEMYIESLLMSTSMDTKGVERSALADLVPRACVVDLRITLRVSHRVVEADDTESLVDAVHVDRVVGAADVGVGAVALDGQLVVVAADVERFTVGAVEFRRPAD